MMGLKANGLGSGDDGKCEWGSADNAVSFEWSY